MVDVLIFGGLGQVGEALVATAAEFGREAETVLQLGRADADITDPEAVAAVLAEHKPIVAINCAVFQPVDLCESEPGAAFAVNATAAGELAQACRRAGTRLVHLSTDYVFGGVLRKPRTEEDIPAPPSIYAVSKLAGEHLVLAASPTHMVVRTSGVYGTAREGHGTAPFIERMLERAQAKMGTQVVTDQVISPTFAEDLARAIWDLLRCGGTGVFHAANRGEMSWFELAEYVFDKVGTRRFLAPTTAAEHGAPAPRSAYTALDNRRLRRLVGTDMPPIRDALERYFAARHGELQTVSASE
jgi:dTDP-4-dehydrorhamnose reductase